MFPDQLSTCHCAGLKGLADGQLRGGQELYQALEFSSGNLYYVRRKT
jgi:hypothetical protein